MKFPEWLLLLLPLHYPISGEWLSGACTAGTVDICDSFPVKLDPLLNECNTHSNLRQTEISALALCNTICLSCFQHKYFHSLVIAEEMKPLEESEIANLFLRTTNIFLCQPFIQHWVTKILCQGYRAEIRNQETSERTLHSVPWA